MNERTVLVCVCVVNDLVAGQSNSSLLDDEGLCWVVPEQVRRVEVCIISLHSIETISFETNFHT